MDDDDFGDDDLDAIPDNTLQELESKAFSSTQRPKSNPVSALQQPRIQTYGAPGLSRKHNAGKSAWRPPQPRQQPHQRGQNVPPASAPDPPSSDYGFDDEDVIDLDEPSMVIQSTSALPTRGRVEPSARPATHPARYESKAALDPETEAAFAAADAELGALRPELWDSAPHLQPKASDGIDVSSLQARVAELEAEQAQLRQAEQEARDAALAKQGEIAIVRANQEKATKEYERRIAVMQKLHADEAAKQKAELEAGRKEREKMETDNRFLQHDLAQEAERAKRLTGPGKARAAPGGTERAGETPRKSKRAVTSGDGFEDEEVVRLVSPSKSKEKDKSREQTPKVGAKRKRIAQDSPVPVLSFTQPPSQSVREESGEQLQTSSESQVGAAVVAKEDGRYEFMQQMLNHCPYEGHGRSVETLMKHAFPSSPARSLSSILLDGFSSHNTTQGESLPVKLSRVLLKLWKRCLDEEYYPPIYLLLDMIRFALYYELSLTIAQLVEEAVPLCIKSIDVVAVPIARASKTPSFTASDQFKTSEQVAEHIDVDEILDFLHHLCGAASLSAERIETFWQNMEFTFTLLMLNKALPISQIITTLQILSTSVLPMTFGPICHQDIEGQAERQARQERDTIDRLMSLLLEMLEVPKDEPAYTDQEITKLRIGILNVLKALCLTDHGGLLLAQHRSAIGRLIRFLDGQVNQLYTTRPSLSLEYPPEPNSSRNDEESSQPIHPPHALLTTTVNTTVRLLYHLLRTHDSTINFGQKMSVIKGGYHRFIVSMTRIAFAEQIVFEAGIEDEVVEAAHSILDNILSPEEGEAIVKAVEMPRGTRGTSTYVGETTEEGDGSAGEKEGDIGVSDPG